MRKNNIYRQQNNLNPYFIIGSGRCGTELMAHVLSLSTNSMCFHQNTSMTYNEINQIYHHEKSCQFAKDIFKRLKDNIDKISNNRLIYGESSNHLFFLPNLDSVNDYYYPKYIFCIRDPIAFVSSALSRGIYDPNHPNPLLNLLLPCKDDPITPFWNEIPPPIKCLWYWIAKNDYIYINLVKKISPKNWRILLFENINNEVIFKDLFNFLNLKGFKDNILKIRFFMNTRINATPTSENHNILSTNPKSISGVKFTREDLSPPMRNLFDELLYSSISYHKFYKNSSKSIKNRLPEASNVYRKNIDRMIIGSFNLDDSLKSEKLNAVNNFHDIEEKKTKKLELNEKEYYLIKKRGLIGERDTPNNPNFIKSGYSKIMLKRYKSALSVCHGKVVLDVGCGLGWGVNIIKDTASKVYGIDYDSKSIQYCKEKYHHDNVCFKVMDCCEITFQINTFDVVLLMEVIEHLSLESGYKCISEITKILKPDGMLIGTTYIPSTDYERKSHVERSDNEYHLHIYTKHEMGKLLSEYFYKYKIIGETSFVASFPKVPEKSMSSDNYNLIVNKKQKRILLTTSAAPSQSPFSTIEKRPPIGIGYLISVLRNARHKVFFIDNYLKQSNFLETDYLQRKQIDYVGIYANTICYRDTLRMLYKLNYLRCTGKWSGKVIVGGPHATVALHTIPYFVDYVVQGEGEQAILDIVNGAVTERVVKYPRIKNLDELPRPAWDYFVNLPYNWGGNWFPEKPVFTLNTSRGCPFKCTFCSVGSIWDKGYTYFSAERIVSDIEYLIKHYRAKGIYFREDNFTLNRKRLKKFCKLLLHKGIKIRWACETRVDTLDKDLIELMYRAGARAFYFGVESGCQRVLDFLKKGIKIEQTKYAFKLCHEIGIKTAASVIVGVPTETEAEVGQTISLLKEIKPDVTWFNIFVGIPNSDLYKYTLENNLYKLIDDRGLVYPKGYDERVKKFYGNRWNAQIPINFSNPKISVIMSVYNGSKYLEGAIKSILTQTYQDFEFIIINDASTDNTSEVLKKYNDPRIRIITNTKNLGLTKSLNKGIDIARGKYIARMDADDISLPHRFETQIKFLERNPDYALVGSSYYQIDKNGQIIKIINVITSNDEIKEGLKKQNWFGHGSVMMRKDALLSVGGYDERFKLAQDYDLWLRIAEKYKMANVREPLYSWRTTSSCVSNDQKDEQARYAQMAIEEAEKRLKIPNAQRSYPLVSVIIPTYNRPKELSRAINSVMKQTNKSCEIIIVNDAGPDVSAVIDKFDTSKIKYVKHKHNKGLAAARNTGIKNASGSYIALLDDDDQFLPNHLETVKKYLNEDTKVVYTDAIRFTYNKNHNGYQLVQKSVPYSIDFDRDKLLIGNIAPVNCFVFEKQLAFTAGLFDESLEVLEDWDFWIRLSEKVDFIHVPISTVRVNWKTDGTTLTSSKSAAFKRVREKIFDKNRKEIARIPNKEAILAEFKEIWSRDWSHDRRKLVSIIILTYNALEYTEKCLASIWKNTCHPHEIIFIDNASSDGTVQYLEELVDENQSYRLIKNETNRGFAGGNNQGMKIARGDYLLLLNNDVLVPEGWLRRLVDCAEAHENIGLVGPISNWASGRQTVKDVAYQDMADFPEFAARIAQVNAKKYTPRRRLAGFAMLIKRAVYEKIGGLDERFGNGNYEDDDYSLRALKAGFNIMVAEDVYLHHFISQTFKSNQLDYLASLDRNKKIFRQKWPDVDLDWLREERERLVDRNDRLVNTARQALQAGKHAEALSALKSVLASDPVHQKALQELAIYNRKMELQIPIANKKEKIMYSDVDKDELYQKIQAAKDRGQSDQAMVWINQLLKQNPRDAQAFNMAGVIFFEDQQLEEAKQSFVAAIENDPGLIDAQRNYGEVLLAQGDYTNSVNTFVRILGNHPDDVPTLIRMAELYIETDRRDEAQVYLQRATQLDPQNSRIKELSEIVTHSENAASVEAAMTEDTEDELFQAVLRTKADGKGSEAMKLIRDLLELNPRHAGAYNMAGVIFFEQGELENARKSFAAAITMDTDFLDAKRNFAEILLEMEEYNKGVQAYASILEEHPDDVPTLVRMAELNDEVGRKKEAREFAEKVLEFEPGNVAARQIVALN